MGLPPWLGDHGRPLRTLCRIFWIQLTANLAKKYQCFSTRPKWMRLSLKLSLLRKLIFHHYKSKEDRLMFIMPCFTPSLWFRNTRICRLVSYSLLMWKHILPKTLSNSSERWRTSRRSMERLYVLKSIWSEISTPIWPPAHLRTTSSISRDWWSLQKLFTSIS